MPETASSVRIVGMIGVRREAASASGATVSVFGGGINPGADLPAGIDPDYILEFARVHEDSGFDMVLTGYSSSTPDGFEVAGYAGAHTKKLGYLITHRPGFVMPTLASRKAATLDPLTRGRIALHIISGHIRRQRPGAAERRRLAGPRLPLPAHRRVHGDTEADLDRA